MADDNKIVTQKTTTSKAPTAPVAPAKPVAPQAAAPSSGQDLKTTPVTKKATPARKTVARPAATPGTATTTPAPAAAGATKAPASAPTPAPRPAPAAAPRPAPAPKPVPSATAAPRPTAARSKRVSPPTAVTAEEREAMIRDAAYFIAEKHGFDPNLNALNWEEATQQIDTLLAKGGL